MPLFYYARQSSLATKEGAKLWHLSLKKVGRGPGSGALTYKLAKKAKNVLCYEIDTSLKEILENNLNGLSNVKIKFEDFLLSNPQNEIKKLWL